MNATLRERIIVFLVGKFGSSLASVLTGAVAALLSKLLVLAAAQLAFYPPLAQLATEFIQSIDQAKLVGAIWILLMALVHFATNHWLTADAKTIQDTLNQSGAGLDVDGWVGPLTVREFQKQIGTPAK